MELMLLSAIIGLNCTFAAFRRSRETSSNGKAGSDCGVLVAAWTEAGHSGIKIQGGFRCCLVAFVVKKL